MSEETAPTRSDTDVESNSDEPSTAGDACESSTAGDTREPSTSGDLSEPCERSSERPAAALVVDDTEPPPDHVPSDGNAPDDDDDAGIEAEQSEPLAYRIERLRLWRTVVTLAVVVARLIRSL